MDAYSCSFLILAAPIFKLFFHVQIFSMHLLLTNDSSHYVSFRYVLFWSDPTAVVWNVLKDAADLFSVIL